MATIRHALHRLANVGRKIAAGLTLHGESISPVVPNDLYQAHLSIYWFASTRAANRRVLDIGCGAGYGVCALLGGGAISVIGIDLDERNISFARRMYSSPRLAFQVADIEGENTHLGEFDVIIASNVFEHLRDARSALSGAARYLAPGGELLVAVPPIVDENTMRANRNIPYHRSNYYVGQWMIMLKEVFRDVELYSHLPPDSCHLDFADPSPSRVTPDQFSFVRVTEKEFLRRFGLTAVFVAAK